MVLAIGLLVAQSARSRRMVSHIQCAGLLEDPGNLLCAHSPGGRAALMTSTVERLPTSDYLQDKIICFTTSSSHVLHIIKTQHSSSATVKLCKVRVVIYKRNLPCGHTVVIVRSKLSTLSRETPSLMSYSGIISALRAGMNEMTVGTED